MIAYIYHAENLNFFPDVNAVQDLDNFNLVASYENEEADNENQFLNEVFENSNSIENYWGENPGVELFIERNRSSSVGDIFAINDNFYIVDNFGFKEANVIEYCS